MPSALVQYICKLPVDWPGVFYYRQTDFYKLFLRMPFNEYKKKKQVGG
jgi:hypothetical protein